MTIYMVFYDDRHGLSLPMGYDDFCPANSEFIHIISVTIVERNDHE